MSEIAIEVKNVSKRFKLDNSKDLMKILRKTYRQNSPYNYVNALDNVSFTVKKGEVLGIIGLNGSGKSTLLRTVAGLYKPDSGSVNVVGHLAPMLQIGTGFHNELDAIDNVLMYGMLLGMKKNEIKERLDRIIEYAELQKFSKTKLKHYSSGMRARLGFATVIHTKSDILLVDEILTVGDKNFREKCLDAFDSFKKQGKTILHISHSLELISKFSDSTMLIDKGKIIKVGNPADVIRYYSEMTRN